MSWILYVLLVLELYALVRPKGRRFCWPVLLVIHTALFVLVPFFGTVFLWLDGACNYLWGTALAILPLLLVPRLMEKKHTALSVMAVPICFLSGWTNENAACGVLAAVCAGPFLLSRSVVVAGAKAAASAVYFGGIVPVLQLFLNNIVVQGVTWLFHGILQFIHWLFTLFPPKPLERTEIVSTDEVIANAQKAAEDAEPLINGMSMLTVLGILLAVLCAVLVVRHFLRQKFSRAAVEPHAERRGLRRAHALAHKRRDQACQHVPAPAL